MCEGISAIIEFGTFYSFIEMTADSHRWSQITALIILHITALGRVKSHMAAYDRSDGDLFFSAVVFNAAFCNLMQRKVFRCTFSWSY